MEENFSIDEILSAVNEIRKTLHYISSLSEMDNEFAVRPPLSEEQEVSMTKTREDRNKEILFIIL